MADAPAKLIVHIDHKPYEAPSNPMTGRQLKELGGLNPSDRLFLEVSGKGDDRQIGDDENVTLEPGMQFYHLPPDITAGHEL